MKTKLVSAFVLAALLPLGGAWAQTPASDSPAVASATAPNQTVYSPRLPSAAELTSAAAAQGLTVEKIEQGNAQVTATYKNSAGQINVVSYQLLPATSAAPAANTVVTPSPAPVVVQQAPSVVYQQAPSVVYYEPAYGYYPRYYSSYGYYPPVSLSLGFGFRGGYRGGYGGGVYHGGFHHWR